MSWFKKKEEKAKKESEKKEEVKEGKTFGDPVCCIEFD